MVLPKSVRWQHVFWPISNMVAKRQQHGSHGSLITVGEIVLSESSVADACAQVPQSLKDDIAYAHENIAPFAQTQ